MEVSREIGLEQVENKEHEDPHQVHEVPVKADFFNHFVSVAARSIQTAGGIDGYDTQEEYAGKNVKTVKAGDEKEQCAKGFRALRNRMQLTGIRSFGVKNIRLLKHYFPVVLMPVEQVRLALFDFGNSAVFH